MTRECLIEGRTSLWRWSRHPPKAQEKEESPWLQQMIAMVLQAQATRATLVYWLNNRNRHTDTATYDQPLIVNMWIVALL